MYKTKRPTDPNLAMGLFLEGWMTKWWRHLVVVLLLAMMFAVGASIGKSMSRTIISPCASADR